MIVSQNSSGSPPSYTWATKPSAVGQLGQLIIISDVGVNGSLWFSNGTKWVHESPIILQQATKGWIVPSLADANAATYSQAGTVITVTSVGHNIPATVHDGKDVYLAIASGDAAAGWFTNFTRTGVDTFTCESSISQTTSGTVNTNTAETTVSGVAFTILGGLMGDSGTLEVVAQFSCKASAVAKNMRWKFDGVTAIQGTTISTTNDFELAKLIKNRNNSAQQIIRHALTGAYSAHTANAITYSTVDTSLNVDTNATLQVAAANDSISLESIILMVRPS